VGLAGVIALVRVDNRLLHGQILEAWLPRLKAARIVIADDEAARSALARQAMTLCLPPELPAQIAPVDGVDWDHLAAAKEPVLVLVRDVKDLTRAAETGLTPSLAPRVNVGNVHFGPGRKPVTPSVFLDASEVRALEALAGSGFEVELRAIPSDAPLGAAEIAERHRSAR
jgi:PTS system N-acetylgalactosamine-specific IIB component